MKVFYTAFFIFFLLIPFESSKAEEIGLTIDIMPWDKANTFLPKYSKFIVMDSETGFRFKVQRRAGSNHADVQPLTKEDTAIMKKIYNGEWSWKRRAIIVIHKDRWIAASMHGMPHGGGALKNNFPGHFCIHFYGSTTHRTNAMDLSHKLMVLKAAGKLDEHLASVDPYELVQSYIAGFKQQDQSILRTASLQKIKWKPIINQVENVGIGRMYMLPAEDINDELSLSVPVEIDWFITGEGRRRYKGAIHLVRFSPIGAWKVDSQRFLHESLSM
ncbi:hypothetical protein [Neobacillus sp. D3-1R]|uniref:hypothetical protein n=1 Tax=Neobacillus sp. D3-1R TaxID=3445778 RepID=UPI003F9FFA66